MFASRKCGNGVADPGENCTNCPADVQCPLFTPCVAGVCSLSCGNGVVDPGEDCQNCPADFDGDDLVGIGDFLALLANWGRC